MITIKSTIVKTSKIYGSNNNSLKLVRGLFVGQEEKYRAFIGKNLVYDAWDATLKTKSSVEMEATGGAVDDIIQVESFGVDYDKNEHTLAYTIIPALIDRNDSEENKLHTVRVGQPDSGKYIDITIIQNGKKLLNTSYNDPIVTGIDTEDVPASGGYSSVYALYTQLKNMHYSNGVTETLTLTGNIQATILGGNKGYGTTSIVDGQLKVESAYKDEYSSKRLVYTVSKVGFTINGKYIETSAEAKIYQSPNTKNNPSYGGWNVSCSNTGSGSIPNYGGTFSVTVNSYRTVTDSWTSNYSESWTQYGTGTVTGSNCTVRQTSFTGKSGGVTITADVGNNSGGARSCTITINSNGISKSASRTQSAVSYSFSIGSGYECNASQSVVNVVVTSIKNGSPWAISKSDVSVPSTASVGTISQSGNNFIIPVTVYANTGTTRTITVTVTLPGSGTKKSTTITQASGIVRGIAEITITTSINSSRSTITYSTKLDATDTSKYQGGNLGTLSVYINTGANLSGENIYNTNIATNLVLNEGSSKTYTGTITIPLNYRNSPLYFYLFSTVGNTTKLLSSKQVASASGGGGSEEEDEDVPEG